MTEDKSAALKQIEASVQSKLQKFVIAPPGNVRLESVRSMLRIGSKMRDQVMIELPLLNEAANAYQDLASTREWTVSGKETSVARTVDFINNARTWDFTNGMIEVGFEQVLRRRALDHILVGRTAYHITDSVFEYFDPTKLTYHKKVITQDSRGNVLPVKDTDIVWSYGAGSGGDPYIPWGDVKLNHALPLGFNGFIAPVMLVYPTAIMAWLLLEHDKMQLDGRKLRDILIVGKGLYEPIIQAIDRTLALWTGEDPSRVGIPVVEASQMPSPGTKLEDLITRLGLSNIPQSFDRAQFDHMYANQIAGAFGLALRQFWQDDSNTNRALEEVQEARQQLKGPLAFVRAEQRLINASRIVTMFAPASRPCWFSFLEETDTSSLKDRAQALSFFADALLKIGTAVGARLKPEFLIRKAQQLELLPTDVPIEEMLMSAEEMQALVEQQAQQAQADEGEGQVQQSSDQRSNEDDEVTQLKMLLELMPSKQKPMEEGDIIMNSKGIVVERRRGRMFTKHAIYEKALTKPLDHNEISRYDDENDDGESNDGPADPSFLQGMLEAAGSVG